MKGKQKTIWLDAPDAEALANALASALTEMGAKQTGGWSLLGGSQLLEREVFHIGRSKIGVRAETYQPYRIKGDPQLIEELERRVKAKCGAYSVDEAGKRID